MNVLFQTEPRMLLKTFLHFELFSFHTTEACMETVIKYSQIKPVLDCICFVTSRSDSLGGCGWLIYVYLFLTNLKIPTKKFEKINYQRKAWKNKFHQKRGGDGLIGCMYWSVINCCLLACTGGFIFKLKIRTAFYNCNSGNAWLDTEWEWLVNEIAWLIGDHDDDTWEHPEFSTWTRNA